MLQARLGTASVQCGQCGSTVGVPPPPGPPVADPPPAAQHSSGGKRAGVLLIVFSVLVVVVGLVPSLNPLAWASSDRGGSSDQGIAFFLLGGLAFGLGVFLLVRGGGPKRPG